LRYPLGDQAGGIARRNAFLKRPRMGGVAIVAVKKVVAARNRQTESV
jgi:hypothetical protein